MDIPNLDNQLLLPSRNAAGRQVKVMIKEIYKHTAACNACRTRKRKCDGKAPCSYCIAKKQPCEFSQQRKRGPPRRLPSDDNGVAPIAIPPSGVKDLSLHTATLENYMVDFVEAKSFIDYYWSYIKHRVPGETPQFILAPQTTADKIQAYATLAFASRISGNLSKASTYISQARSLAGTVFDHPQPDAIGALMMMSHYWQLVLDIPLARFYAEVGIALSRLTPVEGKLAMFCKVGEIMCQEKMSKRDKSAMVKLELSQSKRKGVIHQCPFMDAAAEILGILGFNVLFPEEIALKKFLDIMDDVSISEHDRAVLTAAINTLRLHSTLTAQSIADILFYEIFCALYQAICEWKSGHPGAALVYAKTCVNAILQLRSFHQIGIASDFPHICMLGTLCKLFYEQGEHKAVVQVCEFIREVCQLMQPEFNFVTTLIDNYLETNIKDFEDSSPDSTNISSPSGSSSSTPSSPPTPSSPVTISPTHDSLPTSHHLPPCTTNNEQIFATALLHPLIDDSHTLHPDSTYYPQTTTQTTLQTTLLLTPQIIPLFYTHTTSDQLLHIADNSQNSTETPNNYVQAPPTSVEHSLFLVDTFLNGTEHTSLNSFDLSYPLINM